MQLEAATTSHAMSVEIKELNAELDRMASVVAMPSGTLLFRCGDPVCGVFLIHRGAVTMYIDTPGTPLLTKNLGPLPGFRRL
jgi:hypothetical protein